MFKRKTFITLIIVTTILVFASLITLVVLGLMRLLDNHGLVTFSLVLSVMVAIIFDVYFIIRVVSFRTTIRKLLSSNTYNLGKATTCYDLDLYSETVENLKENKKYGKKTQYTVAFTAGNKAMMINVDRNNIITNLNGSISLELYSILCQFEGKKELINHIYCFDRGVFYIYCFGDSEIRVRELAEVIRAKVMDIVERNQVRFYIDPIFGFTPSSKDTFVREDIDNASIARDYAERRFERITMYQSDMRRLVSEQETKEIIEGLQNKEFVVYYQPKYSLTEKRFTSSEALVRWNSKHGLLPPAKFIGIAESAGLIHEIDTFVFKKVCEDLNDSKRRGRRLLPVSVNFSLYEFFSTSFLDTILELLDTYSIDPSLIQIEITETTSQTNQFMSVSIIKKLQEKGMKILMDDFGVGFSNLRNLNKIPFDGIKVDKSFVDNIEKDSKAAEIIKFVIQLIKANNMEAIAEGVDNAKQVEVLKKYKCDTIQGFYYAKPMPKSDFDKFLVNNPFESKEVR